MSCKSCEGENAAHSVAVIWTIMAGAPQLNSSCSGASFGGSGIVTFTTSASRGPTTMVRLSKSTRRTDGALR